MGDSIPIFFLMALMLIGFTKRKRNDPLFKKRSLIQEEIKKSLKDLNNKISNAKSEKQYLAIEDEVIDLQRKYKDFPSVKRMCIDIIERIENLRGAIKTNNAKN